MADRPTGDAAPRKSPRQERPSPAARPRPPVSTDRTLDAAGGGRSVGRQPDQPRRSAIPSDTVPTEPSPQPKASVTAGGSATEPGAGPGASPGARPVGPVYGASRDGGAAARAAAPPSGRGGTNERRAEQIASTAPTPDPIGSAPPAPGRRTPPGAGVGNDAAPDPLDPSAWHDDFDVWEESPAVAAGEWDEPEAAAAPARRPGRPALRPRRAARPALALPAALQTADLLADRTAAALLLGNIASALLMAVVLGTQLGRLPAVLVVHLDAAGLPDRWGPPRTLWRLPLIAVGATLMNAVLAWFLAPLDRVAARFALAAALVVQLLAWIALFDFV